MGWWDITGPKKEYCWGDEPSDILDSAVEEIMKVFKKEWERLPTVFELEEGLRSSIFVHDLDEEE